MSDYAYDIVDALYRDDKIDVMDFVSAAMKERSIEAISDKRVEIAQSWFSSQTEEEE
jgi:hypothetical protein